MRRTGARRACCSRRGGTVSSEVTCESHDGAQRSGWVGGVTKHPGQVDAIGDGCCQRGCHRVWRLVEIAIIGLVHRFPVPVCGPLCRDCETHIVERLEASAMTLCAPSSFPTTPTVAAFSTAGVNRRRLRHHCRRRGVRARAVPRSTCAPSRSDTKTNTSAANTCSRIPGQASSAPMSVSTPGATLWSTTRTDEVRSPWPRSAAWNCETIRSPLEGSGEGFSVQLSASALRSDGCILLLEVAARAVRQWWKRP